MTAAQIDVTAWTRAPLRINLSASLRADAAAVFHAVSDPETICEVFAWMARVTLATPANDGAMGVGTLRRCVMANGLLLEEEIIHWQPPYSYAFRGLEESHPFGMRGHVSVISLEPDPTGCRLIWQQYFDHGHVPAMRAQLELSMEAAVRDLIRRFGGRYVKKTTGH